MRYPPSILEEIRARLPVSAVVGRRVKLQRAGREYKGLSPFNAEKSPSFFVNDQKGFYHDFSSGKHGDIFSFLMEVEGLAFPEAVERLAAEAGVALPKQSAEAEMQETRRKGLHEVMQLAQDFFAAQLIGRNGGKARAYLAGRGLETRVFEEFGLGYALGERHALRDHLAGKGVPVDTMIEAGLLIAGDDIPVPYDRFRDRVMFPIADAKGRVIAFGGRALDKDIPAKYLNSPDTPLFQKGDVLYNHHRARKSAHDKGTVIAVEGYVDVIAMSRAGFAHCVAPLGTALTENQLGLLWRMASEPILCFDGDKAGRRAAFRAIDVALPLLEAGKSLRFALLPEGQDPDDLARSGGGRAIADVLDKAMPLVDLLWMRETEARPLDTPERRAALQKDLRERVNLLRDEDLKRFYRAEMDQRLNALFPTPGRAPWQPNRPGQAPYQRGGRWDRQPAMGLRGQPLTTSQSLIQSPLFTRTGKISPREAFILSVLTARPELLASEADMLAELEFDHPDCRAVAAALLNCLARGDGDLLPADLWAALENAGVSAALARIGASVRPGDSRCLGPDTKHDDIADALRQAVTLHRRAVTLHNELRAAERALADENDESSLAWIRDLQLQLSALDGMEADRDRIGMFSGLDGQDGEASREGGLQAFRPAVARDADVG
jgi:DNA primase